PFHPPQHPRQGPGGLVSDGHADPGAPGSRPECEPESDPMIATLLLAWLVAPAMGLAAPVFNSEVRLVVLHPTVRNHKGELVTSLDRDAFRVFENGKAQPITVFHRDDVPVSLGILIDNSGSMASLRAKVEAAALSFARASNPQDEV